jgi:gluconolactonase
MIAHLLYYTEGPAIDSEGNIYCTTLTGGSILKIQPGGTLTEWGKTACPNGQVILSGGDHLVCDSKLGSVRRFSAGGRIIKDEISKTCAGIPVYIPNDLCIDADGGFYFTDSLRKSGKIFYSGPDGTQSVVATGLDYPNGIALSNDQTTLYVAESYKNRILQISLKKRGLAENLPRVLANLPSHPSGKAVCNLPDGLTLDMHGNIWVAHYGMHSACQISPEGALLSSLHTSLRLTSNLIFVAPSVLLVTGGDGEPGPGALVEFNLKLN